MLRRAAAFNKDLPTLVVHRQGGDVRQSPSLDFCKLLLLGHKGWQGDLSDARRSALQNGLVLPFRAVVTNQCLQHREGDHVAICRFLVVFLAKGRKAPLPVDAVPNSHRTRPPIEKLDLQLGTLSRGLLLPIEASCRGLLANLVVVVLALCRQAAVVVDQPPRPTCRDIQKDPATPLGGSRNVARINCCVQLVLVSKSACHFS